MATEPKQPDGVTGVLDIECRQHNIEPSEYLVSFGGTKDGVGAFYVGKIAGVDLLTALLRKLGVTAPAIRTALQVLMAEPLHKIPNVTLMPDDFRELTR